MIKTKNKINTNPEIEVVITNNIENYISVMLFSDFQRLAVKKGYKKISYQVGFSSFPNVKRVDKSKLKYE